MGINIYKQDGKFLVTTDVMVGIEVTHEQEACEFDTLAEAKEYAGCVAEEQGVEVNDMTNRSEKAKVTTAPAKRSFDKKEYTRVGAISTPDAAAVVKKKLKAKFPKIKFHTVENKYAKPEGKAVLFYANGRGLDKIVVREPVKANAATSTFDAAEFLENRGLIHLYSGKREVKDPAKATTIQVGYDEGWIKPNQIPTLVPAIEQKYGGSWKFDHVDHFGAMGIGAAWFKRAGGSNGKKSKNDAGKPGFKSDITGTSKRPLTKSEIRTIAGTVGTRFIKNDAIDFVLDHVKTIRNRQKAIDTAQKVLENAYKLTKHANRNIITRDDVDMAIRTQGATKDAARPQLFVAYSSWFESHEYDKAKMANVLGDAGAKNIHYENHGGSSKQPKVVVFTGITASVANQALQKALGTDRVTVGQKSWRTKKKATNKVAASEYLCFYTGEPIPLDEMIAVDKKMAALEERVGDENYEEFLDALGAMRTDPKIQSKAPYVHKFKGTGNNVVNVCNAVYKKALALYNSNADNDAKKSRKG